MRLKEIYARMEMDKEIIINDGDNITHCVVWTFNEEIHYKELSTTAKWYQDWRVWKIDVYDGRLKVWVK